MKTWIPRLLQDDGMIPMCEAPFYAQTVMQYVALADHQQALAEKDREIAHVQDVYTKQRIKHEDDYQQLMAQAVRFATYLQASMDVSDVGGMGMYEQVQAFLKEHQRG